MLASVEEPLRVKAKVCMVGALAVGKTSLVRRYTLDLFEDRYITTLGTKVSKKTVDLTLDGTPRRIVLDMLLWDIMGQPAFRGLLADAYFYEAKGILAVADLTRPETFEELDGWVGAIHDVAGVVPLLLVGNKSDLTNGSDGGTDKLAEAADDLGCDSIVASAKTGENVEETFQQLGVATARYRVSRS